MSGQKKLTEAEVRKTVQKALKKVLKEVEDEPKFIIIEAYPDKAVVDSKQLEDILSGLFKRTEVNNGY